MDKKIVVVYYTQTGQLEEIIQTFCTPFSQVGLTVEYCRVRPKKEFPFPWTSPQFFDAMPESVLGIPSELEPIEFMHSKYDLVLLAYQPWFLSPSIPVTSILEHSSFQNIVKGTPVMTLIGARNMWIMAQERVKKRLKELGANLVGNIVLIDKNQNHVSAVTILYWMLTGKKDRCLGIFPLPGIAHKDIAESKTFAPLLLPHLQSGDWNGLQSELVAHKAVEFFPDLQFIEQTGSKLFAIWANVIKKKKKRAVWLVAFKYYLLIALFIVAPIVLFVRNLLFRPFLGKQIQRKKQLYLGLN